MAKLVSLGKYELIKRIAVGGMSEIYMASQGGLHGFERAVIVKCIREDLDTDREVLDMFLDEARIAACLKHPNIVHLYDVGEDQGIPYLAMEYIFGRDLLQISERCRALGWALPVQFVLKVLCDSLAGLNYAHYVAEFEDKPLNVIHRDISPQNVIVSFDGITKILDFGIAKAASRLSQTQAGVLKGKYAYMSPEQVRGEQLDHRSDQFSLAVVFYEVLTGTRLFFRDDDYSTMEAVDLAEVPPIRVLRKDIPRRLMWTLRKALRRNPKRRYKSCKDMERACDKLMKGSSVEQTEGVAKFMRKLFATELQAREQAIEQAAEKQREILMSTGFEMVGGRATIKPAPAPPLAHTRYEEIVSERQGVKTQIRAKPKPHQDTEVVREGDTDVDLTKKVRSSRSLLSDWRFMLVVFLAVLVVSFYLLITLGNRGTEPSEHKTHGGGMEDMKTTARPGLDGFLSVSARPTVRVLVDDENFGNGAFRNHPLPVGIHKVVFQDTENGNRQTVSVNIEADREFILAPDRWQ